MWESHRAGRIFAAIIAGCAWLALTIQLTFNVEHGLARGVPVLSSLITYFSFFTIITNLVVAIILTVSLTAPDWSRFWSHASTKSALVVYIVIVGSVYALLLRHLWNPQGLQRFADILLHDVIPLSYPLYWLAFISKGVLRWIYPLLWLIYPVIYFIYSLLRGAFVGLYPYPFIDVATLGYERILINALMFLVAFLGLGLLLVAIDHAAAARQPKQTRLAAQPNSDK